MNAHYLPTKLRGYLLRLHLQYERSGKHLERDLIRACRFHVLEEDEYDNWNGGTYGHQVILFLPLEEIARVDIEAQSQIGSSICDDLNKLSLSVQNEYFSAVVLEAEDLNDPRYQASIAFSRRPTVDPASLPAWKPGFVRLFITHRDQYKKEANDLARSLEKYGISSFVAHDTIQPMTEWRREIMKSLETMEVMLVFLTEDFEDSVWTNQEVGFALGKAIPIISLKLGKKDPPGFISHEQAMRGYLESLEEAAIGLYSLIGQAVGKQDRLNEALISSFVEATSFIDAKERFNRLEAVVEKITEKQEKNIIDGFYRNDQLHHSVYLVGKYNRLIRFLERATSKEYELKGRVIQQRNREQTTAPDEIPF